MSEIVSLISTVGFPIAVAAYLLVTFNRTIKDHTAATLKLTELIQKLCDMSGRPQG